MSQEQFLAEYKSEIQQHLDKLTDRLVAELRPITQGDFGPTAYRLSFEVDMGEMGRGFPVHWFVTSQDWSFVSDGRLLLEDIGYTVPYSLMTDKKYEKAGIDMRGSEFEWLVHWFSECWRKAGGAQCRYLAIIGHHDSTWAYDLNTMQQITT